LRRALAGLTACLTLAGASAAQAQERPPDLRRIVQLNLQTAENVETSLRRDRGPLPREVSIFSGDTPVSNVEILNSQKKVETTRYGWAWQTCIRATARNVKVTLAVFVIEHRVVDARTALGVDRCDEGAYVSLPVKRPAKPVKKSSRDLTATSST
jgi:hypothetical protein